MAIKVVAVALAVAVGGWAYPNVVDVAQDVVSLGFR
jgi:hypothetical protein